jgi:CO/xanthine dehydrogenase Mo-binding subunit
MTSTSKFDRRDFIKLGAVAGGGLLLGVRVPEKTGRMVAPVPTSFEPNVFVRVTPDGIVTIRVAKSDMGQGVRTGLPMIVADELDADWSMVRIEQADAHPTKYGRMMTVGSSSVRGGAWTPLRQAGAAAREMLVAAAAARLGVNASELRTEKSRVLHDATKRTLSYGELADAAGAMPVPAQPKLKDPSAFRIIGTRVPVIDTPVKVTGRAKYGIDTRTPGMLFATVVHPPVFGGKVASFDATGAKAVRGVKDVVEVSQGVAVVAASTWAALQGAKALKVVWDDGPFAMSSDDIFKHFAQLAEGTGVSARSDGTAESALAGAAKRIEAVYEAPYLAHATMEPMNCTADVRSGKCEIWAPTQSPQSIQSAAARLTGLAPDAVVVHVTFIGCGWGRRSSTDWAVDAIETSMKVGAPVQVLWTREEDMQHDFYRPAAHVRFEGGLDASGRVTALRARIVAQAIQGRTGVDGPAVEWIASNPYGIPNQLVQYYRPDLAVPVGYWRSVGPSQNAFILESFIDELAHAAGKDPVELRRELLATQPRFKKVVELAAEKSGWGSPLPAGRARGIGLAENMGSVVAEVAEVSLENGRVRVHKVTCAADCGRVIHPGLVEGQLTGAIVGGLSAALYGEITIEKGRVKQGNFNDYRMVRINEAPEVSVHLVNTDAEPTGVGEPGVPPIAPAVANALFALTGTRIRRLPIRPETLATPAVPGKSRS